MRAGQLRKALEALPDDTIVLIAIPELLHPSMGSGAVELSSARAQSMAPVSHEACHWDDPPDDPEQGWMYDGPAQPCVVLGGSWPIEDDGSEPEERSQSISVRRIGDGPVVVSAMGGGVGGLGERTSIDMSELRPGDVLTIEVVGASTSALSPLLVEEVARLHDQGVRVEADGLLDMIVNGYRRRDADQ